MENLKKVSEKPCEKNTEIEEAANELYNELIIIKNSNNGHLKDSIIINEEDKYEIFDTDEDEEMNIEK